MPTNEVTETLAQMTQDARDALTWSDVIEYAVVRNLKVAFQPLPPIDQMVVSVYKPVNAWSDPDGDDELLLEFGVKLDAPAWAIDMFVEHLASEPRRDGEKLLGERQGKPLAL